LRINVISKEILWNNSFIKSGENTFFYRKWFQKGIKHVEDIYNFMTRKFHKFSHIQNIYGVDRSDFLKYTALVSKISVEWKEKINLEHQIENPAATFLETIMRIKKPTQILYKQFLRKYNNPQQNKAEIKWNAIFDNLDWKNIYKMPFMSTIDTKLRTFQYKYVTRILPTNVLLYKCKLSNSSLCDFCNMHTETLKHLFWECHHIQHFWSRLKTYLCGKNMVFNMDYKVISFGSNKDHSQHILDFIILLAKYFIFKSKLEKSVPNYMNVIKYLKERKTIEEQIAFMKDKLNTHNKKWNQLIFD